MTLTTPYSATFYVGDGETKTFPYLFEEVSESFISVIVYNSLTGQSSTPTYIVDTDQKQVIFGDDTPAPTADETVCIYRNTPNVQDTPFRTLQGYDAKALENILSKIVAMIQEIKSNYFTTQVLQGDPWQLDLLTSADNGATVNIDYTAKKLVKGLYFQITNGNLQVSADGSSYITMPKSADIVEFRQVQTVLEDLTVQYRLQYRIGNEWFNAESNAEATADEAKQIAEEARDIASDAKDIAQDASDKVDGFDDRITQAEQDASDAKDIAQDASDAVSAHITDTNNPHSVTASQVGLGNVDNTSDADKPISDATQSALDGLQDEIDDLKGLGRFLSVWNCATGLAETNPLESPYTYHTGDYFLVGTVGATNYRPDGSSYTIGVASTTVETAEVKVNDVYIYDGTTWKLQANSQREYTFSGIAGSPYDNTALSNALNSKVDETSSANQVYGTDQNGDPTTYNTTDFGAVDDVQVNNVSVVTSKIANIDLTNYVTLSTTQAITGTKTFKSEILSWNNITFESAQANPIIRAMSGASHRNMITRTNSASAIDVGNTSDTINFKGSGTRPTYNSNDLAMYSDVPAAQVNSDWNASSGVAEILNKPTIPTVNNPTITITQGGVTKGSFTLNQATGDTIALDAGGGSSVDIDNSTITRNIDQEIQAVAVIDQNTGIAKTWTGTMAEYDAIVTKDPETEYIITDDIGGSATEIGEITEALNDKVDKGHQVIAFQEPTTANDYTWYRKYADGWVEQGGFHSGTGSWGTASISLPVEMANVYYTLTFGGNIADNNISMFTSSNSTSDRATTRALSATRTTTSFLVQTQDNVTWQVSGMAA